MDKNCQHGYVGVGTMETNRCVYCGHKQVFLSPGKMVHKNRVPMTWRETIRAFIKTQIATVGE